MFIAVFDGELSTLEYGTIIGGSSSDTLTDVQVFPQDKLFFMVSSDSKDMNMTPGCFDPLCRPSYFGESFWRFNLTDHKVEYGSFFGNATPLDPADFGIIIEDPDNVILIGTAPEDGIPVKNATFNAECGGKYDVFLARISLLPCDLPYTPTAFSATGGNGLVKLSWAVPVLRNGMVSAHRVYRGLTPDNVSFLKEVPFVRSVDNATTDYDVVNGTRYFYRITAVNGRGESDMTGLPAPFATPRGPPTVPLNVTVTTGDGKVTIAWREPEHGGGFQIRGFRVVRATSRQALDPLSPIATLGPDDRGFNDTSVKLRDTYYYAVLAFSDFGPGPMCGPVFARVTDRPSAPQGFMVVPGDGTNTLTWMYPGSDGALIVTAYRIYRYVAGEGSELLAELVNPSELKYVDSSLENGVSYVYEVAAVNPNGEGDRTVATEGIPFRMPGPPTGLAATAGDGVVRLGWSPPADSGGWEVLTYKIYRGATDVSADMAPVGTVGRATAFNDTGVTNGVRFYYRVSAVTAKGESPLSASADAVPMSLPSVPMTLTAVLDGDVVKLGWTAPSELGGAAAVVYNVYKATSGGPLELLRQVRGATSLADASVAKGTTYEYAVSAANDFGEGPMTDPVSIAVVGLPGPPEGLTASISSKKVILTWAAPSSDGGSPVTGYAVLRGLFVDGLQDIAQLGDVVSYTDTQVENDRTYFYSVVAVNAVGHGEGTPPVAVTPIGGPRAVTNAKAAVKGTTVTLTWSAPSAGGRANVTGYLIYRGNSTTSLAAIADIGPVTTYVDSAVEEGRTYYYKVVALSDVGEGDPMAAALEVPVKEKGKEGGPGFGAVAVMSAMAAAGSALGASRRGRRREG